MKKEIWKDVKHYEGLYQVSNYGRVKSVKRNVTRDDGTIYHYNEKYLSINCNNGYMKVYLSKNGKTKAEYVHRLVALAFIPNPDNKPQVNHKDENKQNNYVDNLEWATCKENVNYGTRSTRQSETIIKTGIKKNGNHPQARKVKCNGIIFDCIKDCAEYYGINYNSIWNWLNNKYPIPSGFSDMELQYLN